MSKSECRVGVIVKGPVFDMGYRFVVIDRDGRTILGHYKTEDEAETMARALNAPKGT